MSGGAALEVDDLVVRFRGRRRRPFGPVPTVHAVDGVSLRIGAGESFGIVGESGSGKSTTALAVARLVAPSGGAIAIAGTDVTALRGRALRRVRRHVSMVFQDPAASLDPRRRVAVLVREPLDLLGIGTPAERRARVAALLDIVGLPPAAAALFPHQFSGGQRQRICIARALASDPALVVCDEPVSALDVAIQAQILNLLARLRRERGLAYLFISHDLGVVQHVCDRVAVMYLGGFVEEAPAAALFASSRHPYTWSLIAAAGGIPAEARAGLLVPGEPPSPLAPPAGCRFVTRCPHAAARCAAERPVLRAVGPGHLVACHRVEELARPNFGEDGGSSSS